MLMILSILMILVTSIIPTFAQEESELDNKIESIAQMLALRVEGEVIDVSGENVYIDVGNNDGVLEGTEFMVIRLGRPIFKGDELITYEETLIGRIKVETVEKNYSIAFVLNKEQDIQKYDKIRTKRKYRVAVTRFAFGEKFSYKDFADNLQSILTNKLFQMGMEVMERNRLNEILDELKIDQSGPIDPNTAKEIGKMLAVKALVVGELSDFGDKVGINARLVDAEKGVVISIADIQIVKAIIDPIFTVEVWVDRSEGGIYYPGDRFYVFFKANRDCYLTLVDFPPQREALIIFPNVYHLNNFIEANCIYEIPAPEDDFAFVLDKLVGMEVIRAIATLKQINFSSQALNKYKDYGEADFAEALATMMNLSKKELATASVRFYIRELKLPKYK